MHHLLRKQLRKIFGDHGPPAGVELLLEAIDEAYRQADLDRTMVERSLELSSQELLEANQELRLRGADLERRVELRATQLLVANRELEREVGERGRAERRAALAEQRLRTLVEALPAITYVAEYEQQGRWEYVSPQVERMLGIRPETLLGRSGAWYELVHPEDRTTVLDEERRCREAFAPFALEYRMIHRSGETLWVRDQALPQRDDGRVVYQGVILDISDRKGLEAELFQAQRVEAIGRLAGGVAHDFNNMLTAITGYAELLLRELPAGSPTAHQADEILRAANRATALTSKLLAFGRRQVLQPHELDLSRIVSGLEPMVRRLIGEDIVLETMLASDLGLVRADPAQIEQVLVNMVINARDAMPAGGTLRLQTENRAARPPAAPPTVSRDATCTTDPHIAVSVEDTGMGIEASHLPLLFEPFFTTKPVGRGTGLGLSTAYGIVRQSGGEIRVESRPGEGARFEILLPRIVARKGDRPSPRPADHPSPAGHEAILLAEDEPAVRDLTALILRELGYRVTTVSDGVEALELVSARENLQIDLLLTDVVMPRIGGVGLAAKLRQKRPELPVLYFSGYAESSPLPADGLALARRDGFLQKPFTRTALAQRIRELLDRQV